MHNNILVKIFFFEIKNSDKYLRSEIVFIWDDIVI